MQGVHTVEEVRAAEEAVLARTAPDELMIRAAAALARTCAELLIAHRGGVYGARVVGLIGTGNNGGDALYACARLAQRGASVELISVGASMHERAAEVARRARCRLIPVTESDAALAQADLVIDGLVGLGGKGELRDEAARLADLATSSGGLVVAVDLPSGVDADTGRAADSAIWADVTVTFGLMKPGLLLQPGAMHAGAIELVDIGIASDAVVPSITSLAARDVAAMLPVPGPLDHKYSQGVVGVVAGSRRYPGAAVLSVGAALHTKTGAVRYVGVADRDVVAAWPSAIVSPDGIPDAERVQAWAVGPGLGTDDSARAQLAQVLAASVPVVVDADALTMMAAQPDLMRHREQLGQITVLTPHLAEFARLAPDLDVSIDPVAAVRTLAARWQCTVLLKGATTVVADADGRVRLNLTGTPWLATAGTGDVLTGVIAALLAGGLGGLDAASAGAFVHGLAGRLAAADAPTPSSLVIDALPGAIRAITRP